MECSSPDAMTEEYQKMRDEALSLEAQFLKIRMALRDTEAALRPDPENQELKTRLEDLKTTLEKLNRKAPWLNSDMPPPYLRGTTSGPL
jgi:chaperonin cofactor prefoldin